MRYTYRHIGILTISLIVASCSFSKKQANNNHDKDMNPNVKIVVLDPGHFHASLLQKNPLASVNDTIRVYAPEGAEVKQYLNDINSYNQRAENPTSWKEEIYSGGDYLSRMLADRQGDIVVLAGNNQKKLYSPIPQSGTALCPEKNHGMSFFPHGAGKTLCRESGLIQPPRRMLH